MGLLPPMLKISFLGCWLVPQSKASPVLQKHAPLFHSHPKLSLQNLGVFSHLVTTCNSCAAQSPNFWVSTFLLVHRSSFSINQFMIQRIFPGLSNQNCHYVTDIIDSSRIFPKNREMTARVTPPESVTNSSRNWSNKYVVHKSMNSYNGSVSGCLFGLWKPLVLASL